MALPSTEVKEPIHTIAYFIVLAKLTKNSPGKTRYLLPYVSHSNLILEKPCKDARPEISVFCIRETVCPRIIFSTRKQTETRNIKTHIRSN